MSNQSGNHSSKMQQLRSDYLNIKKDFSNLQKKYETVNQMLGEHQVTISLLRDELAERENKLRVVSGEAQTLEERKTVRLHTPGSHILFFSS